MMTRFFEKLDFQFVFMSVRLFIRGLHMARTAVNKGKNGIKKQYKFYDRHNVLPTMKPMVRIEKKSILL